jgi:glycosyltransferase involved in cell wall biosynthesis
MCDGMRSRLRIAVGIATKGRPALLCATIAYLEKQTRIPDQLLVAAPASTDVAGIFETAKHALWLPASAGLSAQRNALLRESKQCDVIVFFDDDFLPHPTYLAEVERLFLSNPGVVIATGDVIADGIAGPGLQFDQADALIAADRRTGPATPQIVDVYNGYGCNMAVHIGAARSANISFDENLPLYGWLEDVDFSRRMAPYGRVVRAHGLRGVHLGVKSGRQSGVRLGYSQIANPVYLVNKGTLQAWRALWQVSRNLAMNLALSFHPESYVDRRGRLRGNAIAVKDLLLCRIRPDRILAL